MAIAGRLFPPDANDDGLTDVQVSYGGDSIVLYDGASHAAFWSISSQHAGYLLSGISVANMDDDSAPELVAYHARSSTSSFRFDVLDCASHAVLYSSPEMSPWLLATLSDLARPGVYDVCVITGDSISHTLQVYGWSAGAQELPTSRLSTLRPSPIPCTGRVAIDGTLFCAAEILDATGRIVRTLPPSAGPLVWDGKDQTGEPCPAGCYIVRAGALLSRVDIVR